MDALYPNTFAFNKVKWDCKNDYEFVENYKILQQAFDKNGVKRHIDVPKLIKAKYQDNLEFCQWLKAFFEKNYNGEPYEASARRKGQDLYYLGGTSVPPVTKKSTGDKPATTALSAPKSSGTGAAVKPKISTAKSPRGEESKAGSEGLMELQNQIHDLKLANDTLDKERDFYFSKLRDIELLLQAKKVDEADPSSVEAQILKILYASEDEKVSIGTDGSLTVVSSKASADAEMH